MIQLQMDSRKELLDSLQQKESFRVAIGRSKWKEYTPETYSAYINLREILKSEIVIEFDMPKSWDKGLKAFQEISWSAVNETAINLLNAGFEFEVWDHNGKSPHIHIRNLPITHLEKDQLKLFKKTFIDKFVPEEYSQYSDYSLCGIHLVATEHQLHWKGKYGVKKLINKFGGKN